MRTDIGCYVFTTANGPLTFAISQQPAHGTVSVVSAERPQGLAQVHAEPGLHRPRHPAVHGDRRPAPDQPARDRHPDRLVRRLVARIRGFGAIAVVIVLGGLVLVGSAFAVAASTKPDLVPELPAKRPAGLGKSVAPIYVDAYTMPGKLLYRFDTVIRNQGGTMDLYMQNGNAYQVIWKNGHPPGPVSPNHAPSPGPNIISIENRSAQAGRVLRLLAGDRPQALALPAGGQVRAAAAGRRLEGVRQDRLLHVRHLSVDHQRQAQVLRRRLHRGRRAQLVQPARPGRDVHADGHLADLRRPVRLPGLLAVDRHQRAEAAVLRHPRDRQPAGLRRRGLGDRQQRQDRPPHDPGDDRQRRHQERGARQGAAVRDHRLDREPVGPGAEERATPAPCART